MEKIIINDADTFATFLGSLIKIIPSCKFIVTPKGTKVRLITESKGLRAVFQTNSIVSEKDNIEFCFMDITKLYKSIKLIKDMENNDNLHMNFDGTFLTYNNKVKFKFKTTLEDKISKIIVNQDITSELTSIYSFDVEVDAVKKVLKYVNIVDDIESKVYFIKNEKCLVCEIDNKKNKLSDSIGIPLCLNEDIKGEIDKIVALSLENFKSFTILPIKNININITKENIVVVSMLLKSDKNYIAVKLYSTLMKI
jgi:hypothetical protein